MSWRCVVGTKDGYLLQTMVYWINWLHLVPAVFLVSLLWLPCGGSPSPAGIFSSHWSLCALRLKKEPLVWELTLESISGWLIIYVVSGFSILYLSLMLLWGGGSIVFPKNCVSPLLNSLAIKVCSNFFFVEAVIFFTSLFLWCTHSSSNCFNISGYSRYSNICVFTRCLLFDLWYWIVGLKRSNEMSICWVYLTSNHWMCHCSYRWLDLWLSLDHMDFF